MLTLTAKQVKASLYIPKSFVYNRKSFSVFHSSTSDDGKFQTEKKCSQTFCQINVKCYANKKQCCNCQVQPFVNDLWSMEARAIHI